MKGFADCQQIDLHKACKTGELGEIKAAFYADPGKVNQKDQSLGWTPLYRTVICSNFPACQFLLRCNADPNITNNLGESPLHQASDNSQWQLAELLLQHKAEPNLQQNDGDTPLHYAGFRGDFAVAEVLLRYGADPNLQNFMFGRTPLHSAIESNSEETVKVLLEYNADLYLQDRQGKTPIDLITTQSLLEFIDNFHLDSNDRDGAKNRLNSEYFESPSLKQNRTVFEPDAEISAIGKRNQAKPLFDWLGKSNLLEIFEVLCEAGYDDLDSLFAQMNSSMPITLEDLKRVKIKKPGHRYRFLLKLEEDAVLKKTIGKKNNQFWKCCAVTHNTANGLVGISLRDWLGTLKLEELLQKFIESGFDDYEMLLSQMESKYPITEEILLHEIGVVKPGHRTRLLGKLKEEMKSPLGKTETYLNIESVSTQSSCEPCSIS